MFLGQVTPQIPPVQEQQKSPEPWVQVLVALLGLSIAGAFIFLIFKGRGSGSAKDTRRRLRRLRRMGRYPDIPMFVLGPEREFDPGALLKVVKAPSATPTHQEVLTSGGLA